MQKDMEILRAPQMVYEIGGIIQRMISAVNEHLGGEYLIINSSASNGTTNTLSN